MAQTVISPEQLLAAFAKGRVPAVSLWLGPEQYWRDKCRAALLELRLPGEMREQGYARHDLAEVSLGEVLDDAQSMSLFASERVVFAVGAEAALPRIVKEDSEDAGLAAYCGNPAQGVTVVLDSSRYGFDQEDKPRIERMKKFYASVPVVVEFAKPDAREALEIARKVAGEKKLKLDGGTLELIVESTGGEPARIATELEKLSLAAGDAGVVSPEMVAQLLPNARASSIFALVDAIGRGKTVEALGILDTLVREGEYLPLALSFIGTQFRLALAAHQAGLRTSSQIEQHFRKMGVQIWRSRAEQVAQTVQVFSRSQVEKALRMTAQVDVGLRDARPDDRVVLEQYVLGMRK